MRRLRAWARESIGGSVRESVRLGGGELAVGERDAPGRAQGAGQEAQGGDGVLEDDGGQYVAVEEVEDEAGSADFQKNAGGQDVAIAVDEVEAAVLARVGEWFVAGV